MYIYHALINALGAHIIRINLNTIPYAHIEGQSYQNNLHKALRDLFSSADSVFHMDISLVGYILIFLVNRPKDNVRCTCTSYWRLSFIIRLKNVSRIEIKIQSGHACSEFQI